MTQPVPKFADKLAVGDRVPDEYLPHRFNKGPAEVVFVADDGEAHTFFAFRYPNGQHDSTTLQSAARLMVYPAVAVGHDYSRADDGETTQPIAGRVPPHYGAVEVAGGLVEIDEPYGEYLVSHGPVKPPYGSPEREAYDRAEAERAIAVGTPSTWVDGVDPVEIVHWRSSDLPHFVIACGAESGPHSEHLGKVTCPACLEQVPF
jgi:hypothetical protein